MFFWGYDRAKFSDPSGELIRSDLARTGLKSVRLPFLAFGLMVLLSATILAPALFASGASPELRKPVRPVLEKDCGQRCAYRRASEIIALQAAYIVEKVSILRDQAFWDPKRDGRTGLRPQGKDLLKKNIGRFCQADSQWRRDIQLCWKRYVESARLTVLKLKTAQSRNFDMQGKLAGGGGGQNPVIVRHSPEPPSAPFVPTFDETWDPSYQKLSRKFDPATDESYYEWVTAMDVADRQEPLYRPAREDFAVVDQVARDPKADSANNESKLKLIRRGQDGQVVLDAQAQKKFDAESEKFSSRSKELLNSENGEISDFVKKGLRKKERPHIDLKPSSESEEAFKRARLRLVDAANEKIRGGTTSPGMKPTVASPLRGDEQPDKLPADFKNEIIIDADFDRIMDTLEKVSN